MAYHQLNYIQDIWPNFSVYASGGLAFETYRKDFKKLTIIDTYLASEGFFAYSANPKSMDMRLALSQGYFYEFIPFDERGIDEYGEVKSDVTALTIDEVETGMEYFLVVSGCAGAWRYVIGDTIEFTSLEAVEIKITGRTKFFLNVVGSQLSEEKINQGMVELGQNFETSFNEFMVAALQDETDDYFNQWVLVNDDNLQEEKLKLKLDEILKSKNKNYAVALNKALKSISVKVISKQQYKHYLESTKKAGGQVKTPKVMKAKKMRQLLDFLA